jgi:uncharacterized membrane protein YgcG
MGGQGSAPAPISTSGGRSNPFLNDPENPSDGEVMDHIISVLLEEEIDDGPIHSALQLAGCYVAWAFITLEIDELITERSNNGEELDEPIPLNIVSKKAIADLIDYYDYLMDMDTEQLTLSNHEWMGITLGAFHDYVLRRNRKRREDAKSYASTPSTPPSTPMRGEESPSPRVTRVSFADLPDSPEPETKTEPGTKIEPIVKAKSILDAVKRDLSAYPEMKEERYYDNWIRTVQAIAQVHKVSLVLDAKYVPIGPEETAAFKDMQTFFWAVLVNKLKTPNGRQLIREHGEQMDSQKVFAELQAFERTSMHAEQNSDALYAKLIALDLSKWPGTYVSFLQQWHTSIYMWIELAVGHQDEPKDREKKKLLRNAVCKINVMANIATQETIDLAQNKPAWTYKVYYELLMHQALADDFAKSRTTKSSRTAKETRQSPGTGRSSPGRSGGRGFGGRGRGREGRGGRFGGRGRDNGGRGRGTVRDFERVSPEVWAQLTPEARQVILKNRKPYQANQARIALPPNLMAQLPPLAQRAINEFNDKDANPRIQANQHQQQPQISENTTPTTTQGETSSLGQLTSTEPIGQPYLYDMLSNTHTEPTAGATLVQNGHTYRFVRQHRVHIRLSEHKERVYQNSLIDGGANGGLGGSDVKLLETTDRFADVTGIDGHKMVNLPIGTVAGKVLTTRGPIIAIWHQYVYSGKGHTIHSSHQMRHFMLDVDDKSVNDNGKQRIKTVEGYIIPLKFEDGLPTLPCTKPTDDDMNKFPHVFMTDALPWDPASLDYEFPQTNGEYDEHEALIENPSDFENFDNRVRLDGTFIHPNDGDEYQEQHLELDFSKKAMIHIGDYGPHELDIEHDLIDFPELAVLNQHDSLFEGGTYDNGTYVEAYDAYSAHYLDSDVRTKALAHIFNHKIHLKERDYEGLRCCFAWAPIEVVKKTIENTTQFFNNIFRLPMRKHLKSRHPAANIPRRHEYVATDTFKSDTPAFKLGTKQAQLYVGRRSYVTDVYAMRGEAEIPRTLEDNIRERGAMQCLVSDGAKAATSNKTKDILRLLHIKDWQSEPHNQQQNFAENRMGTIKDYVNKILDRTGCPASMWYLALCYVCMVLNYTASKSLQWQIPIAILWGYDPDISFLLCFAFWEPVLYAEDNHFPSQSPEKTGRFVGFAPNIGDILTFRILTDDTNELITRSVVRPRTTSTDPNRRLDPFGGEENQPVVKTVRAITYRQNDADDPLSRDDVLPTDAPSPQGPLTPDELIGRSFLLEEDEDGQRLKAKIVKKIIAYDEEVQKEIIKFLVEVPDGKMDQLRDYADLLEALEQQSETVGGTQYWNWINISGHQGPLEKNDKNWKGSRFNLLVNWETGESTYEPMKILEEDNVDLVAQYGLEHDLLDQVGWKHLKRRAKNKKVLDRKVNQAKRQHKRFAPVFLYGLEVPRNPDHAAELDRLNGNTKWGDANVAELQGLFDYDFAIDDGPGDTHPYGHLKIRCRMIYTIKHDGRHKARLVAGGHLTPEPENSVYSGVVSHRSLRIIILAAELNHLELLGADITQAYLEALTKEKIYFIAGREFRELGLEGHTLILHKALYGLKSSGQAWHKHFSVTLRAEGFTPSLADPDVWMRMNKKMQLWEYVCVYVDDLALAMVDGRAFLEKLKALPKDGGHGYHLKGDGPLEYHLGCDYTRDKDGVLSFQPKKYINKMLESYERMFGEKPKKASCPIAPGDHPEIDTSEVLDAKSTTVYMSLIGQLQWLVTLGRFDVMSAVVALSSFRSAPRIGHLDRAKRVFGYVANFKEAAIRVRTGLPDYEHLQHKDQDWSDSVYGNMQEEFPHNMPVPLGNLVRITEFVDANLYFDLLTGRACTGILMFLNQTPIDWYCKKQSTVATATFGSEFVATKTAVEKAYDLRFTLRMMGIPVDYRTYMFGDNQAVVTQSTIPHSQLAKRHNALAYHYTREAVASGMVVYNHIPGTENPSDCLTKFLGYQQWWPILRPILFWQGDTARIPTKGE